MLSIVLARRDFREADQFITVFTEECGKRELLARGVKKITSKLSAYLMPFFVLDVEWVPGKENDLLITAQPYTTFRQIIESFEKMNVVRYAAELVDALAAAKQAETKIFNLLVSFLSAVDKDAVQYETVTLSFSLKLFALLGWQPELNRCSNCSKTVGENDAVYFNAGEGVVLHKDCLVGKATVSSGISLLSGRDRMLFKKILESPWQEQTFEVPEIVETAIRAFLVFHYHGTKKMSFLLRLPPG
jgi:DNA repair protein RecO (recombination protein O)